jgi:hypothetical protein
MATLGKYKSRISKAQSAMEYLMTYGWSILILAVVLASLYFLGVFSSIISPSSCIATPGYLCTGIKFSTNLKDHCGLNNEYYNYPSINVTIGSTSSDWTNARFAVMPYGQIITDTSFADEGNKNDFFYWSTLTGVAAQFNTFTQGEEQTMSICVNPGITGDHVGSQFQGSIWAMYDTPTAVNAVTEVATFSVTASR